METKLYIVKYLLLKLFLFLFLLSFMVKTFVFFWRAIKISDWNFFPDKNYHYGYYGAQWG